MLGAAGRWTAATVLPQQQRRAICARTAVRSAAPAVVRSAAQHPSGAGSQPAWAPMVRAERPARLARRGDLPPPPPHAPCVLAAAAGASSAAQAAPAEASGTASAAAGSDITSSISSSLSDLTPPVAAAAPTMEPPGPLVQAGMDALLGFHHLLGTPWWASILLAGVVSRAAMVPLQLHSARLMATLSGLEPHFLQLDLLSRQSPHSPWMRVLVVLKLQWALVKKYKCNPLRLVPGAALQIGTFVLLAVSLRRLLASQQADLSLGGALWFPDLSAVDSSYALPIVVWAAGYALSHVTASYYERKSASMREKAVNSVLLQRERVQVAGRQGAPRAAAPVKAPAVAPPSTAAAAAAPPENAIDKAMSHVRGFFGQLGHFIRGMQVLSILVLPWFPAGVLLLWSSSIGWQALWHAFIRREDVRARLGLTAREQALTDRSLQMSLQRKENVAAATQPAKGLRNKGVKAVSTVSAPTAAASAAAQPAVATNPVAASVRTAAPLAMRPKWTTPAAGTATASPAPKPSADASQK